MIVYARDRFWVRINTHGWHEIWEADRRLGIVGYPEARAFPFCIWYIDRRVTAR